ncbi:hypothetical protein FDECE_4899 [Fusarium decemcellulare]|nr:hypothetical protein FDECE_4899 [Fusarium decemcellulare]
MLAPRISKPVIEHHPDGFGISNSRPRLSWRFLSTGNTARGWVQTAYDIELQYSHNPQPEAHHVHSAESVLVAWPGQELRSRQRATVRVRCWGKHTNHDGIVRPDEIPTEWSPPTTLETALLTRDEWHASLITSSERLGPEFPLHPLRFRRQFELPSSSQPWETARLYITALGVFEACINGRAVSDECMAPGWTSYNHRLTYRVLDVTRHLNLTGPNFLSIEAGEGWYTARLGFRGGTRFLYGGKDIAVMAQLEVTSGDQQWTLNTDDAWMCTASAIQSSEIYDGEVHDMREEDTNWKTGDDSLIWLPTKTVPWPDERRLLTTNSPPVRIIETVKPQKMILSPSGRVIVDFGQNLVGKLRVESVVLTKDARLSFRHAEVLEHGELGTRPLNEAKCEDIIIGSGSTVKNWTPKFTFHGFRYVEVHGWPGSDEALVSNLSASVMHSDIQRRGHFNCSNESVNKLHSNVVWSMRGNFLSIPTDCPQRDERLGWTGDIQVFCPTASFLYDTVGFLESWLQDLSAGQLEEGRNGVPGYVCPEVPLMNWPRAPQAIWHDVTVLTPWDLYTFSSDSALLLSQFESMQAWLENGVDRGSDGLWSLYRWQFGDWLDPNAPPQSPALALTDKVLVADAYLVYVTEVFSKVCSLLQKHDLATKYVDSAKILKRLFQEKYISLRGNIMSNTQTAISLAVQFGLYSNTNQFQTAKESLSKLVRSSQFHIATGFAGTPVITHALTKTGQPQLAYRLLLEPSCPSWMYPLSMGATTVWERWDSMLPDGSINPGRMTSFNHYALGAVADWLHSSVGGISAYDPGWKTVRVRPVPGGNLTHAEVSFDGPYGLVRCAWRLFDQRGDETEARRFELDVVIPPNSSARVTLPCDWKTDASAEREEVYQIVGSGSHKFSCDFVPAEWPPRPLLPPNITYTPEMDKVVE